MPAQRPAVRLSRLAAAAAAIAAFAALAACSSAKADSNGDSGGGGYPLRIGYIGSTSSLTGTFGYLQSKGTLVPALSPAGVTAVKVFGFVNGPDLNQALAAGDLDVGIYGDTPALVARGAGRPTRLLSQPNVGLDAEIVTKKGGPTSLVGLAGQNVSVAKGSYMHRYLLGALADAKAKPSDILNITVADTPAALAHGDIAAAALPIASAEALRAKGFPVIDDLVKDHPHYSGTTVAVATQTFLDKHPGFVTTWQAVQKSSVLQAKTHWSDYLAFSHTLASLAPAVIDATTKASQLQAEPFTPHGLQLLSGTQKFLLSIGLEQKSFSIDDWIAPGARK